MRMSVRVGCKENRNSCFIVVCVTYSQGGRRMNVWQIIKWIFSDGVVCLPLLSFGAAVTDAVLVVVVAGVEAVFPCAFPFSAGCRFHFVSHGMVKNELPFRTQKYPSIRSRSLSLSRTFEKHSVFGHFGHVLASIG